MRTTIDLPDDLHQAVAAIAAHSRRSMNQAVAGLPLIRSPRPVTAEDVRTLEDE